MNHSKRGEYALRALIDIGIASDSGRDLVRVGKLAHRKTLPLKFLGQIITGLQQAGYIDSDPSE